MNLGPKKKNLEILCNGCDSNLKKQVNIFLFFKKLKQILFILFNFDI